MRIKLLRFFIGGVLVALIALFPACSLWSDNGITNKKELRAKKPPSVRIKEDYDRVAKKTGKGRKKIAKKEGKALERALLKNKHKKIKKDKRYLKSRKRKFKKSN